METINDIQIEVTQIVPRKNNVLGERRVFKFKRRIFIANIDSPTEECYLKEHNYITCGALIMKDGEVIKTMELYPELAEIHSRWFKESLDASESSELTP